MGGPLIRETVTTTINPQVGFELVGIKNALTRFCHSHNQSTKRCTIGYFICFFDESGTFLNLIEDIQIKKLEIVFETESDTPWIERLATSGGESDDPQGWLELTNVQCGSGEDDCLKAKPWRIHQYQGPPSNGNYATPNTALNHTPRLIFKDATGYGVEAIKGYRDSLRIAYLDYGTLMHLFLSYRNKHVEGEEIEITEEDLKFIFTGAEINHGEMVSPYFQEERFKDWGKGFVGLDASVTTTLKMEGVYNDIENEDEYISSQTHPFHATSDPTLTLPGVKVLAPCRRFWHTIEQILNSATSQMEFNDLENFEIRQKGVGALSKKLTESYIKDVLGKRIIV